MMKILVTGGAGYIGSFMTKTLLDKGYEVTVFDNLERGHIEAIDKRAGFVKGDIRNDNDLEIVFKNKFDSVIHFAGLIAVGESEEEPDLYYQNNVVGSKKLFDTAYNTGKINKFIFSSSAAVYGNPVKIPIPEDHPKDPTSAYGRNKLEIEESLSRLKKDHPEVSFAALRYFNAAGATLDGLMGEEHVPETHIIPNVINALLKDQAFSLFGDDYKTKDGTCVRDYIHVLDLVEAHLLALKKLNTNGAYFYNVGTGRGYSNNEVIKTVEKVSGRKVNVHVSSRRAGDTDELVADPSKIKTELGFVPKYSDLETIVRSAWIWHTKQN